MALERLIFSEQIEVVPDALGQPIPEFRRVVVYGIRRDRGGREAVFADARGGNWSTRWEVRRTAALRSLSESWTITDDQKNTYDIEAIDIAASRGDRYWWVYATRRVSRV